MRRRAEAVAGLDLERFPLRRRSRLRRQYAGRHSAPRLAHDAVLLAPPDGLYLAPQMDWVPARRLRRLRQYAAGARLCPAGRPGGHEAALRALVLCRGAQSDQSPLHQRRDDDRRRPRSRSDGSSIRARDGRSTEACASRFSSATFGRSARRAIYRAGAPAAFAGPIRAHCLSIDATPENLAADADKRADAARRSA